ncbi:MAG TPA: DegV family protein [Anaerolineales bacterium]|nr:DegV family protein [Anaerolineales bacterium]
MTVAIVTDSTSDLPPELAAAHCITVIPAILTIGDRSLLDGNGITRAAFYRQLPSMAQIPTTAAPASGTFEQAYETLLSQGATQVLSIHIASSLSGIFNVAQSAARNFGGRVQVLDSGSLSMGTGFQALAAAEAAAQGLPLDKVLSMVYAMRRRLHAMAMLDTLEYVRRSGRISWAKASIGSLLQIKLFLSIANGTVSRLGEARTHRKGIERFLQMMRALGPFERLAVLYTDAEADARQALAEFAPSCQYPPLMLSVTTVIGTHLGPNAVGFAAVTR